MQNNVAVRSAQKSFSIGGETFGPGSLIVTRRNNENLQDFDHLVTGLAAEFESTVHTARTGFVEQGRDLGSDDLIYLKTPRIAVLFGPETSSLSSGEIWHFFEQQIRFPITQLGSQYFRDVDLRNYDVLIIPEGTYTFFDDPLLEYISSWVNRGGRFER